MHRFFLWVFRRFLARHLRALRLAHWGQPQVPEGRPLVVYANHPSWWDGIAFTLLSASLFPDRRMFVPMDAAALARYPFFRRLGVFGVEQHHPRGAAAFLRTSQALLRTPAHMLWINAPGRFQDVRDRPVAIAPGLLRLPELAPDACFLPLALEVTFWNERKPELLAAFGPPLEATTLRPAAHATARDLQHHPHYRDGPPGRRRHDPRPVALSRDRTGQGGHGRHLPTLAAPAGPVARRAVRPRHDPRA